MRYNLRPGNRCGSKEKPRSPCVSKTSGLVRLTGVEPVRPSGHKHLKLASLPIPAQPQIAAILTASSLYCLVKDLSTGFFKIFINTHEHTGERGERDFPLAFPEKNGYTGRQESGAGQPADPAGGVRQHKTPRFIFVSPRAGDCRSGPGASILGGKQL